MHIDKQLSEKLSQLKDILSEMKTIIEWRKLKAFENSLHPTRRIIFSDDTGQQLMSKYSNFLSVCAEIDHILKTNGHIIRRSSIIKEFNKLYYEFYYLGTDVRVY